MIIISDSLTGNIKQQFLFSYRVFHRNQVHDSRHLSPALFNRHMIACEQDKLGSG